MNEIKISGVSIDKDASDLKKLKSVSGLRKLKIFSHLEDPEKTDAENQLAIELGLSEDASTVSGSSDGEQQ